MKKEGSRTKRYRQPRLHAASSEGFQFPIVTGSVSELHRSPEMNFRVFCVVAALLLGGCVGPVPKKPLVLSPNDQRISEAIKEALGGMYASWEGPLTFEDIEALKGSDFTEVASESDEWRSFKEKYRDGDEVFYVCTSDESWAMLMGRAGYVLVRGDHGIDFYCTVLN